MCFQLNIMMLILLSRFSESGDSVGFHLCEILAQQGHDLYVTTTSMGNTLNQEIKSASDISIKSKGNITIFSPENEKHEESSPEWITKHHNRYFSYLSKIDDTETVIGMLPGTEQTAIEIKESLKCLLILVSTSEINTSEQDLQNLNAVLSKSDELWSVGSDVYNQNNCILQLSSTILHINHKEILLPPPGRKISIGKILVLLSRFSECEESLPAVLLTTALAKRGHHVYVTTTATGPQLEAEMEKSWELTEKYIGGIELLQPKYRHFETASPEWIQNLPKQYFSYLSEYNVDCIFGTLPGTAQTAVALKKILECKVILLGICKLKSMTMNLRDDIVKSATAADEVWSLGPDMYTHYENMFQRGHLIRHEQALLLPDIAPTFFWEEHQKPKMNDEAVTLVSVWSHPIEYFHYGVKMYSQGRDIEKYYTLSTVLGELNAMRNTDKIQWNIYGLEKNDRKTHDIQNHAKPHKLNINAIEVKTSDYSLSWAKCLAFIVPDLEDETFNFFALTAIYLGIPTLVSGTSSIGRFLESLPCSEKLRAIVNLTGDPQHDTTEWTKKIYNEILSPDGNSQQWATTLSKYLQTIKNFWEPDFENLTRLHEPRRSAKTLYDSTLYEERLTHGKTEAHNCSQHKGTPLTLYCNECQYSVCRKCKTETHISHSTVQITAKYQEITSQLTAFLKECSAQKAKVRDQMIDIVQYKFDIETSTQMAIEEMEQQRNLVQQEILMSCEKQIKRIKRRMDKELTLFNAQVILLQQHDQQREDFENYAIALMKRPRTRDFITDVSSFLNFNHLTEVPARKEKSKEKLLYRHPTLQLVRNPEQRRIYVEDNVLGYFAAEYEEYQRPMPPEAQTSTLKRFESTPSVGGDSAATHI